MSWDEFSTLVSGLLPETPLGRIVSIRSEKDQKIIKNFTPEQKKIYREWRVKKAKEEKYTKEELDKKMIELSNMLSNAFGKKG